MIDKILITGSGGFIGSNLKKYLEKEYKILSPRSAELNLIDEEEVQKYFQIHNDIDFIIHCASVGGARGVQDKDTTVEDNLAMVENLLKSKNPNAKMILFGSGAMYGKSRNLNKVKESEIGNFIPEDLYGKSKMLIAQKIKNRPDIICLNIFACYGYGEKESRFPSYAINCALENQDIIINQNVIFDYLWVEDMQRIVKYFISHHPADNIINITPTKSVSLLEIANIVNNLNGNKSNIIIKNPAMNNEYTGNNSLLLKNYSELKFTDIHDGLKRLLEYKRSFHELS